MLNYRKNWSIDNSLEARIRVACRVPSTNDSKVNCWTIRVDVATITTVICWSCVHLLIWMSQSTQAHTQNEAANFDRTDEWANRLQKKNYWQRQIECDWFFFVFAFRFDVLLFHLCVFGMQTWELKQMICILLIFVTVFVLRRNNFLCVAIACVASSILHSLTTKRKSQQQTNVRPLKANDIINPKIYFDLK